MTPKSHWWLLRGHQTSWTLSSANSMEAAIVQSFNQNRNLTKIPVLAEQMLLFLQQQEAVEQDRLIPVMELTKTGINVVQIKVCTYLLCS